MISPSKQNRVQRSHIHGTQKVFISSATFHSTLDLPHMSHVKHRAAVSPSSLDAWLCCLVEINPQTGQPDYSEQWAAYYRQMGWHEQADAILKNAGTGAAPVQ